jgi:hypothetical protein
MIYNSVEEANKIEKCIDSCISCEQEDSCQKMIETYKKRWPNDKLLHRFLAIKFDDKFHE